MVAPSVEILPAFSSESEKTTPSASCEASPSRSVKFEARARRNQNDASSSMNGRQASAPMSSSTSAFLRHCSVRWPLKSGARALEALSSDVGQGYTSLLCREISVEVDRNG